MTHHALFWMWRSWWSFFKSPDVTFQRLNSWNFYNCLCFSWYVVLNVKQLKFSFFMSSHVKFLRLSNSKFGNYLYLPCSLFWMLRSWNVNFLVTWCFVSKVKWLKFWQLFVLPMVPCLDDKQLKISLFFMSPDILFQRLNK